MVQVVPKWRVDVKLSNGVERSVWISDHHISNVLRQVAQMEFAEGLVHTVGVTVSLA